MEYNIKDLTPSGNPHIGKEFWICDYRIPDLNKKPIRALEPTKAILTECDESHGRVNYSCTVFMKGKKVIKLHDNTGYRSMAGCPISVFDNEQECRDFFNTQLDKIITDLTAELENRTHQLNAQIDMFRKLKSD